jgi:hypothetical protein
MMKVYKHDEIKKLPKAWISVTEALPQIGTEVIVFIPEKIEMGRNPVTALVRLIRYEGATGYYWDNNYGTGNTHVQDAVTMWQPMPDAPTEFIEAEA